MGVRAAVLAALGSLLLGGVGVGCSLLIDTSELDADNQTSRTDAGGEAGGGGPNTNGEAGTLDGPPVSGTEVCKGTIHCETFDEGDPLSRHSLDTDDATRITIESNAQFVSPPRAAKFAIDPSTNGSPDATLEFRTKTGVASFVFEGSIFIERDQPNQPGRILRLNNEIAAKPLDLTHNGRLTLDDNLIGEIGTIPRGRWVRLRVEVKGSNLFISYDNGAKSLGPLPLGGPLDKATLMVRFGISEANSPNVGWIVYWDDITVREN